MNSIINQMCVLVPVQLRGTRQPSALLLHKLRAEAQVAVGEALQAAAAVAAAVVEAVAVVEEAWVVA